MPPELVIVSVVRNPVPHWSSMAYRTVQVGRSAGGGAGFFAGGGLVGDVVVFLAAAVVVVGADEVGAGALDDVAAGCSVVRGKVPWLKGGRSEAMLITTRLPSAATTPDTTAMRRKITPACCCGYAASRARRSRRSRCSSVSAGSRPARWRALPIRRSTCLLITSSSAPARAKVSHPAGRGFLEENDDDPLFDLGGRRPDAAASGRPAREIGRRRAVVVRRTRVGAQA